MKLKHFTLEHADIYYKHGYAVKFKNGKIYLEKENDKKC